MKIKFILPMLITFFVCSVHGAVALIYDGPGACSEGCSLAAARVAQFAGMKIRFVGKTLLEPSVFEQADLWIQPGGDAIVVAKRFSASEKDLLRNFVFSGHGYLGFCAGAFFADKWVDDNNTISGLGIIPVETADFGTSQESLILPIDWEGILRYIYFEKGGYFKTDPHSPVKVVARYSDGTAATIYNQFGRGRVATSGVHPEALAEWKKDLIDPDGPDEDLAIRMINWILRR